jgi:hypothetical protein
METIDQQVINDNKDIYAKIQSELFAAEFEILIATAWFTDEELFNIVLSKLGAGVRVEVIIADNQENEKLDFELLAAKGASVYKIKNSGYGIMNQKFCVIDKRLALHGSYNWSMNAKKNNQESIISTNHQETITSLIDNFNSIKTRIIEQRSQPEKEIIPKPERSKGIPVEQPVKTAAEFEQLLDAMIAAEVGNFDRKLLREQGFERCSANNGDHQVLYKAFDTLYSVFINDIDVIDDKKSRLITKIEQHRVKNLDSLNKQTELQIAFLEQENALSQTNLEVKKTSIEAEIAIVKKNIDELNEHKIPFLEAKKAELEDTIKQAEREFIKPQLKWFDFIPTAIFNLALLIYIFLFYSSAAYILLFSIEDAKEAQAQGLPVKAAQIFNPDALGQAFHKSGTAPGFVLLFVFIPLAFAVIDRFVSGKWVPYVSFIFGVILLDGAVAYKVTQAVHEVNYASGTVNVAWQPLMAFSDPNFWLVFVFGAFGLFLFGHAFKKLMSIFEDRNPDISLQRNRLLIKQLREDMTVHTNDILTLKENIVVFEKDIIQFKAEIRHIDLELAQLPVLLNQNLQNKRSQLIADSDTIDRIAAIYTTHIQSDNLPVSIDALKDRINVFLEGWNDFLHKEYSIIRAMLKTAQAAEVALAWQNEKLTRTKVDKRVKLSASE